MGAALADREGRLDPCASPVRFIHERGFKPGLRLSLLTLIVPDGHMDRIDRPTLQRLARVNHISGLFGLLSAAVPDGFPGFFGYAELKRSLQDILPVAFQLPGEIGRLVDPQRLILMKDSKMMDSEHCSLLTDMMQ